MDEVWKKCLRPEWIIWIATRPGVLKDTDLIRFAVWSVRQVQHLLTDPRGLAALDTVDRYLAGTATKEEVEAAADAAYAAARAAADAAYAARAAADAAYAAARAAGYVVVDDGTEELLIRTFVKHDGIMRLPNVAKAMVKAARGIVSPVVREAFCSSLRDLHRERLDKPDDDERGWTVDGVAELLGGPTK
jgi:hypothetical protein